MPRFALTVLIAVLFKGNSAGQSAFAAAQGDSVLQLRTNEVDSSTSGNVDAREPIRAPKTDGHFKQVSSYVEVDPVPAYRHASETAYEAFHDWKFGIRIHWGLYSIDGKGAESWPLLKLSNENKQRYQNLYKTWNPQGFNAEEWMQFFDRSGIRLMAFTSKHHEGFSMFDTKTRVKQRVNWTAPGGPKFEACDLAYSIMDTPFHRDVIKELCNAAHKHDIKIELYYSHPDWYDADFRDINDSPAGKLGKATPEERVRMLVRHRAQLKEIISNYGRVDLVCLDQWMDKAAWPTLRETMLQLRGLQPDVMYRNRGIGNYGDYYTPEGFVPGAKENTNMPWMVIYPLGGSFSYLKHDHFKGTRWIITNLIDVVAKGGNFMPGIGPDGDGRFDPEAIHELEAAGAWLKVNGEAIYATRPRDGSLWKQGDNVRFTSSKGGKTIYAIFLKWPGRTASIESVRPVEGTKVTMLGAATPLTWQYSLGKGLSVELPESLQNEENRPCQNAWTLKISDCSETTGTTTTVAPHGNAPVVTTSAIKLHQ
jgi:alpha-L-fucosidase